jgi:uncharacterized protein YjbI with pentapeptide repeats
MTINAGTKTDKEEPLTRADVERLLRKVGSPKELNLSGRNLKGIDLAHFDLSMANLSGANLSGANLREASLSGTNLIMADLSMSNLSEADLSRAFLVNAVLFGADLSGAFLRGASLSGADLRQAILFKADLFDTDLSDANLSKADLRGAFLRGANLSNANLSEADLSRAFLFKTLLREANLDRAKLDEADLNGATISEYLKEQLRNRGAMGLVNIEDLDAQKEHVLGDPHTTRIRIIEDPLTAQNLTTIISALTELSTKYWLIAKGRFADLIEYTQTHNGRFAEEANVIVTKVAYNSPFNMDWKVDLSAPGVAEALVTTIDGITQVPKRLKQKELEIQAKTQELQHAEQQADHEKQMASLEEEQKRLEIEKQRLEVLEKQLEVQKKGIEYALEIARKVVDLLHPGADPATRAMELQTLLPNLVQLQNGKGLELALPVSQNEKPTTSNESA